MGYRHKTHTKTLLEPNHHSACTYHMAIPLPQRALAWPYLSLPLFCNSLFLNMLIKHEKPVSAQRRQGGNIGHGKEKVTALLLQTASGTPGSYAGDSTRIDI